MSLEDIFLSLTTEENTEAVAASEQATTENTEGAANA
jgi:hypothetical protein